MADREPDHDLELNVDIICLFNEWQRRKQKQKMHMNCDEWNLMEV